MGYQIGQIVETGPERVLQAGAGPAGWFALLTRAQKEGAAQEWLRRNGVEAWYPTRYRYTRHGPRRQRRSWRIAPGYLFARFDGMPNWSALFSEDPGARWLRGVVGVDGRPVPIAPAQMAQVAGMPDRLLEGELALRARAEAARRIAPGERVRVTVGAFEGFVVEVSEVTGGAARLLVPLFGDDREVWCDLHHLARIVGPC